MVAVILDSGTISIHTPREGSDWESKRSARSASYFNPHSPRGERPAAWNIIKNLFLFQSTLPARGATQGTASCPASILFQSTLPARGATGCRENGRLCSGYFNPHSPRGERHVVLSRVIRQQIFQSTLPARGATPEAANILRRILISIHTPREGSDVAATRQCRPCLNFNPHSPRGERPGQ